MNTRETPLSKDKVLKCAMDMADDAGLEGISMRKLADRLGVKAMSLYNHVANKDEIIDGLVEAVIAQMGLPDTTANWKWVMKQRGVSAHQVLMRHPWATMPIVSRVNSGPNMLAYVNATLGCLHHGGFTLAESDHAWNAMDNYIYGFTLHSINFPFEEGAYGEVAKAYLPAIPQSELPFLFALTQEIAQERHSGINDFEFGFDFILDGLEQRLLNK